jgi:NTE family protein
VYGAAQAGMLAELARAGFQPDVIIGVSAGALNGTYMAAGFEHPRAEELTTIWEGLERRTVFPARNVTQLVHIVSGHGALQPDHGLRNLVERCSPIQDLSEAKTPVHVGAVCVRSGELIWWTSGPALPRLCASAALPGVIKPVDVDGRLFFDGGVLANVPVPRAAQLGAQQIIVLDVAPATNRDDAPGSALDALLRAFSHTRNALHAKEMDSLTAGASIIRISGELPKVGASDFGRGAELVEAGREVALQGLEQYPEILNPPSAETLARKWYSISRQREALFRGRMPARSATERSTT